MSEECKNDFDLSNKATEYNIPYTASIEIITKCNFHCEHCYIPEHTDEMDFKMVIDIINQLKSMGIFEIMITGGEIVLHQSFMKIVRYMRQQGIRVILFSNISMLSEKQIKELSELYIKEISTTLFSTNDDINASITGVNNSAQLVINKAKLIRKYNIPLEIKVPIMKKNKETYADIAEFCKENNIKITHSAAITGKTNGDMSTSEFGLDQNELTHFIQKYESLSEIQERVEGDTKSYLCDGIGNSLHIDVHGNVYPCIVHSTLIHTNNCEPCRGRGH